MYNSIYPVKINPYVPPNKKKQVGASGDEPSQGAQAQKEQRALQQSDNNQSSRKTFDRQEYPNGQKSQIDYSKCKVNIAQIITDFKNTAQAIGTPDYIVEEVDGYLALAETQSLKAEPNKKIIQANLKNASSILDDFISKTLNKKSKVVENWVEALFLQQVDYKSDPKSINPDFLVKLPDKDNKKVPVTPQNQSQPAQIQEKVTVEQIADTTVSAPVKTSKVYIPSDPELKQSFLQGKKYLAANDPQKALAMFGAALSQAQNVGDAQAESMICFEIGQIYDKDDNLEEALKYYYQSLQNTTDNNLKAKAYYSMAQIYNDVVYFEPAMNHYYAAISVAGEAENFNAQTKALTDIAQMYAERYDKNNTKQYITVAKEIAAETKDNKTIGAIYSKSGDTMRMLEENAVALNDYKESAKYYEKAESPIKIARNYEKAAFVMSKLGNTNKAKSLMQKAYNIAYSNGSTDYAQKLQEMLVAF